MSLSGSALARALRAEAKEREKQESRNRGATPPEIPVDLGTPPPSPARPSTDRPSARTGTPHPGSSSAPGSEAEVRKERRKSKRGSSRHAIKGKGATPGSPELERPHKRRAFPLVDVPEERRHRPGWDVDAEASGLESAEVALRLGAGHLLPEDARQCDETSPDELLCSSIVSVQQGMIALVGLYRRVQRFGEIQKELEEKNTLLQNAEALHKAEMEARVKAEADLKSAQKEVTDLKAQAVLRSTALTNAQKALAEEQKKSTALTRALEEGDQKAREEGVAQFKASTAYLHDSASYYAKEFVGYKKLITRIFPDNGLDFSKVRVSAVEEVDEPADEEVIQEI